MNSRLLLGISSVIFLAGCDMSPAFQNEAWERVKGNLKAPSTAKIASFKAYPVAQDQKKAYFLRSCDGVRYGFIARQKIADRGWDMKLFLGIILASLPKEDAAEAAASLRLAAPSGAKVIDECLAPPKGSTYTLDGTYEISKKERSAFASAMEPIIKKVAAQELVRYEKIPSLEAVNIFIEYDSQNSYGAMLRGLAHFYGVSVNGSRTLLDTDEPFDYALVGLPEPKTP